MQLGQLVEVRASSLVVGARAIAGTGVRVSEGANTYSEAVLGATLEATTVLEAGGGGEGGGGPFFSSTDDIFFIDYQMRQSDKEKK